MTSTRFTQADVTRALKGAVAAGVVVQRVEFERDGRMVLISAVGTDHSPDEADMTPLELRRARRGES